MKKQKGSQNHRRARKKSRRNAVVATGRNERSTASLSPVRRARAAASAFDISHCMVSENMFDIGIGHVVVGRTISATTVATGVFLVDVHCLGIKNAFYTEWTHEELAYLTDRMTGDVRLVDIAPECARKMVDGAIAYAKSLGFSAHPDSVAAEALFGDIDPAHCLTDHAFGKDGKPFYVSGPNDTPATIRKVMRTLTASVGDGNFEYMVSATGL